MTPEQLSRGKELDQINDIAINALENIRDIENAPSLDLYLTAFPDSSGGKAGFRGLDQDRLLEVIQEEVRRQYESAKKEFENL